VSILIVELLDCGIVFGADQNVDIPNQDDPNKEIKIFKWPREDVLFGYVGVARLGGLDIKKWLDSQLSQFTNRMRLSEIAEHLRDQIEKQYLEDNYSTNPPLIVHLGGYEYSEWGYIPQIWHIANVKRLGRFNYLEFTREFYCVDGFAVEMRKREVSDLEIQDYLCVLAKQFNPFWFHQGFDYMAFNILEQAVKQAYKGLCSVHPDSDFVLPRNIEDWEKQVRFSILMYGAYFQAYKPRNEQYVGGEADTLAIPWPKFK